MRSKTFQIQGSESDPYNVKFTKHDNGDLFATCTCRAGIFSPWCKHRQAVLDGKIDVKCVEGTQEDAADVQHWLRDSPLGKLLALKHETENRVRQMQAEIKLFKNQELEPIHDKMRDWTVAR